MNVTESLEILCAYWALPTVTAAGPESYEAVRGLLVPLQLIKICIRDAKYI